MLAFLKSILVGTIKRVVTLLLATAIVITGLEAWSWFSLPPILRGLAPGFVSRGSVAMEEEYRNRIRLKFPAGTREENLVRDLTTEGFEDGAVWNGRRYVSFASGSFPCRLSWTVSWKANTSVALEDVDADLNASCL
jgi:hypothetical protein